VRALRVLVLMHPSLVPPDDAEEHPEEEAYRWKTEYDVVTTLRRMGHEAQPLGVQDELAPIRGAIEGWKPHVVFNLLEEFHGIGHFDAHVVSYLELLRVPYTGCNPRGLTLARDKAIAKKLLAYHHVRTPAFATYPLGRRIGRRPRGLEYPLFVKSAREEASLGIAQASVVTNDERLRERVAFVHENVGTDAIVESYIEGRELYVGVIGNRRLQTLPVWELRFEDLPPGSAPIATERVKHDPRYQEARGIFQGPADELPAGMEALIQRTSRRVYRTLELDGYARIDFRLGADGQLFCLEANPNPEIAAREEFAQAADAAGIQYAALLQRILGLGLRRASD